MVRQRRGRASPASDSQARPRSRLGACACNTARWGGGGSSRGARDSGDSSQWQSSVLAVGDGVATAPCRLRPALQRAASRGWRLCWRTPLPSGRPAAAVGAHSEPFRAAHEEMGTTSGCVRNAFLTSAIQAEGGHKCPTPSTGISVCADGKAGLAAAAHVVFCKAVGARRNERRRDFLVPIPSRHDEDRFAVLRSGEQGVTVARRRGSWERGGKSGGVSGRGPRREGGRCELQWQIKRRESEFLGMKCDRGECAMADPLYIARRIIVCCAGWGRAGGRGALRPLHRSQRPPQ